MGQKTFGSENTVLRGSGPERRTYLRDYREVQWSQQLKSVTLALAWEAGTEDTVERPCLNK